MTNPTDLARTVGALFGGNGLTFEQQVAEAEKILRAEVALAAFAPVFDSIAASAHHNSRSKGFWQEEPAQPLQFKLARIALMHSELSEALEGIRKDLADDHLPHRSMEVCELADTVIRILDYAGGYSLPLGEVILEKMAYNSGRPFMHGKRA